ncbi:hypothetical protein GW17_00036988 [Ensete ventricosum]|nr:hypothetical protein GW17_00036988 [Ensete ventricosum]
MRKSSDSGFATSCCSTDPRLCSALWPPWSNLPVDVMEIAERLLPNAANRSWWLIVKEETSLARQLPWLMLAEEEIDAPYSGSNICRIYGNSNGNASRRMGGRLQSGAAGRASSWGTIREIHRQQ